MILTGFCIRFVAKGFGSKSSVHYEIELTMGNVAVFDKV